jgi:hypothetical protein
MERSPEVVTWSNGQLISVFSDWTQSIILTRTEETPDFLLKNDETVLFLKDKGLQF